MAKSILKQRAKERFGEPLDVVIPRLVAEEGSIHGAAVRLGVFPNAIRNWMKRHGYRLKPQIVELEKVDGEHA